MIQTPSKNIPISTRPRWGKDYADPSTFIDPLFNGANIIPSGNTNYALVGLTPTQAKQMGIKGSIANVPSIDKLANACAGEGRQRAAHVLRGTRPSADDAGRALGSVHVGEPGQRPRPEVTKWTFDQNAGFAAFAHAAVKK